MLHRGLLALVVVCAVAGLGWASDVDSGPAKGDKVPASLYKIGLSYNRLKNAEQYEKYLRTLIQKYPKSPEAAAARDRLGTKPKAKS